MPVVHAFKANKRRYNLLNSAMIELFEFIRRVNEIISFNHDEIYFFFFFFLLHSRKILKH